MTLEQTLDAAIKAFMSGEVENTEMSKASPSKYNKKYFDAVDSHYFNNKDKKKSVK